MTMEGHKTMAKTQDVKIPHQGEIELITGNFSAAYGALVSKVTCTPFFPITPQTEIMEAFAQWRSKGIYTGQFRTLESEHSVMSAAIGSQMTGQRTFTGSSSQGLLLMFEMLPIAAGNRLPLVMANVSRGISAPITLWSDHNDILMTRDTGFITYISERNQEILDSVIIGYRVGEDKRVMLPSAVNMDGFTHSFTREPVHIPSVEQIDKFLPPLKMDITLDTDNPMTLGIPVIPGYTEFRQQVQRAMNNAIEVIDQAHKEFEKITGRRYDIFDQFMMDDAEYVIMGIGANACIMKEGVKRMREKGVKVGMVRPRVVRPFVHERLADILKDVKRVAVVDQNNSPGSGGILYLEVCKALRQGNQEILNNYIAGLGGYPVKATDMEDIIKDLKKSDKDGLKWVM